MRSLRLPAYALSEMPGGWEWVLIGALSLPVLLLKAGILVFAIWYLLGMAKENRRTRLELGKVAHELERLRKELESRDKD
ncbi:MAG: hypothetical protein AMXMBFR84_39490 [Candidatus Hydrogenedentota bacterium]